MSKVSFTQAGIIHLFALSDASGIFLDGSLWTPTLGPS